MSAWHRHTLDPVHTVHPAASPYDTPARTTLRDTVRAFAMDEVLPVANELDPRHEDIPAALLDRMGELGLFGVLIPEDEGGLGLGVYEYCLVSEELARAWMSVGSIIARGNGTGCDSADPDRRLTLRRASAAGRRIGAIAFSEPEAGSDLANVACRAERDGDGWLVTGTKRWVGHALAADFIHLLARTRPPREDRGPSDGLELFLVEKERGEFPAGVTGTPIDKIGYFGLTTWELELDGLRLPADALQDTGEEEGQGFKHSLGWLHVARAQTAARAVGLARGALEDALTYCQQRVQFGEPIGNQQVIRHMLADMSAEVAAARQLYQHAAWLVDAGQPANTETSQAKLFASEMAERVTSQALQIFGGNGYTTQFAAERYWRDARLTRIFEGTSEIQRRIIADSLLADAPVDA
jgi:alkylation response protein AidB-like acyl-CoA dehydrogenase